MAFQTLGPASDIAPGAGKLFEVERRQIAVFNLNGEFYAIDDICTHEEASLSDGAIDGDTVECPWHGALFNIKTGAAMTMPAVTAVRTYPVKIEDGKIMIDVTVAAPGSGA